MKCYITEETDLQKPFVMQLNNIQILCTRLLEEQLINKAAAKNIDIKTVSFIDTQPITTSNNIQQIQQWASKEITVVFTSTNAVASVELYLPNKPDWQIYCLGGATKIKVSDVFGKTTIAATAKNATALAEKIIAEKKTKEVVFFCGDQRLDDLPEALTQHSIDVEEVIVYTVIQTPEFIEENYNGIIFFSPGAVHSFFFS